MPEPMKPKENQAPRNAAAVAARCGWRLLHQTDGRSCRCPFFYAAQIDYSTSDCNFIQGNLPSPSHFNSFISLAPVLIHKIAAPDLKLKHLKQLHFSTTP